jgi:hypothetical protein
MELGMELGRELGSWNLRRVLQRREPRDARAGVVHGGAHLSAPQISRLTLTLTARARPFDRHPAVPTRPCAALSTLLCSIRQIFEINAFAVHNKYFSFTEAVQHERGGGVWRPPPAASSLIINHQSLRPPAHMLCMPRPPPALRVFGLRSSHFSELVFNH